MAWLSKEPPRIQDSSERKKDLPDGVWLKCSSCQEIILKNDFENNLKVCPICFYHHRLTVDERLELLIDAGTFEEWDQSLRSTDPLNFSDGKPYKDKLTAAIKKSNRSDAIMTGSGKLDGILVSIGIMDFYWMGGSMGSVVGEKIVRMFDHASKSNTPVILVSASGGARMHEGLISLMQMARTTVAIARFKELTRKPFISLITDPTTGGVAASFSMLGDLNIAEPKATIGFAGRRVIEQTTKAVLPENFQTSEFCLQHGVIDMIVKRQELKSKLSSLLRILKKA